jgi:hypothetical protein
MTQQFLQSIEPILHHVVAELLVHALISYGRSAKSKKSR